VRGPATAAPASNRSVVRGSVVSYSQTCPRCGRDFAGDDKESVADEIVEHARHDHHHRLDRGIVLAHLEEVHPYERDD
jgi:predicted small metal-binding protein